MATQSAAQQARNRLGGTRRHHPENDPRVAELRDELAAEALADHIRAVVDSAPPLSAAQRERLALLLYPGTAARDGS